MQSFALMIGFGAKSKNFPPRFQTTIPPLLHSQPPTVRRCKKLTVTLGTMGSSTPSKNTEGASKFLLDLPSKGLFSSSVIFSNLGGMRVYVTDHDTSPPENQLIATDQANILIRSLLLKQQQKCGSTSKGAKSVGTNESSRKRAPERGADGRASAKRAASTTQNGLQQEETKSQIPENLQRLTVERLRALLKERGLSLRGKKDELIGRLRGAASSGGSSTTSSAVRL